ncbi:hypothetical protein V9T40_007895 [Parthenolecanium corni]|uniref:Peptidase M3A/M3B catalytic domain-containing protein n=1 Tax=Parthenolecanium corni TaxID=536013 RepID=A0AAN9TIK1_9HEMI
MFSNLNRLTRVLRRRTELCYNQQRSSGFIVLLPEVDPDVADKLLSVCDDLPKFSQLSTDKIFTLMGKSIVDYECVVRNTDRKLQDSPKLYPDLFEDVIDPMEKATTTFDTVCATMKTLYLGNSEFVPPNIYYTLATRAQNARNAKFFLDEVYDRCKNCDKSKLTEEQSRLVDKHVIEGRLNAIDAKPRYRSIHAFKTARLTQRMSQFRIRVEAARSQFYLTLDDPFMVRECPASLLQMMSHVGGGSCEGPWTVKLNYNIGEKFLEFCPDRNIRFIVWHAEDKAASIVEETRELANSVCLEEIRLFRHELAEITGHKNYFEQNLCTKMAGSVENIQNTLNLYLNVARPVQYDEVVQIQEFADKNNFAHPIQLWDLPYWSRKYKKDVFNFDEEMLRPFLPLDKVLNGLFGLCSRLFGLGFEEAKNVDCWHPDVRFFHVYEPNHDKPVAGFYFDPYQRKTKLKASPDEVYLTVIRNSSRIPRPLMPLTALILNLLPPSDERPCVLSFNEVNNLFYKFGHNLLYLLSKSSYSEIAGLNFVEFDASQLCGHFMTNWLYDKETFASISGHYANGQEAPPIDLDGVKKHLAGYNLCKEIFKSNMDIKMHTGRDMFWLDMGRDMWDDHFIFPLSRYFSDPVRYIDIFSGQWGAAYYSHIWSQMLAADIMQAFAEEKDVANTGARFRDTFLTFGGSCHSSEVFRRFMGRDPNPHALLKHYGLSENLNADTNDNTNPDDPKVIVTC